MIQKIQIQAIRAEVDADLHKYITKKIGHLDKYLPKHNPLLQRKRPAITEES